MLTSQQLKDAGIKPGPLFGKCLKLASIEEALAFVAANTEEKTEHKSVKILQFSVWEWLCKHPCLQNMCSIETAGKIASNSEKLRWIMNHSVSINGRTDWSPDDEIPDDITQLVFFPVSTKRRITML